MIPDRYNLKNLRESLNKPDKLVAELERLTTRTINVIAQRVVMKRLFRYRYGSGIDVMEQDWDNLIILDACRYQEFDQYCEIDGEFKPVVSKGSTSREWMNKNFVGGNFHDTVYVGGNPHMEKFSNEFHYVKKSYSKSGMNEKFKMANGSIPGWRPEAVYENAIDTAHEFSNKRLIIHFMQPHDPYIGSKADQLREIVKKREGVSFRKSKEMNGEKIETEETVGSLRAAAQKGYITHEELFEVYIENLNIVFEYVEDLLSELSGKTVITADHGELLGAGRFTTNKYGHPINVWQSELRIVPWLEIDSNGRREIHSENPIGVEEAEDRMVKENLEALGYR